MGVNLYSGLTSYWSFDETSGTTLHDNYDSKNGTCYGGSWNTGGKINGCRLNTGALTNRVEFTASDFAFTPSSAWTFSFWIKILSRNYTSGLIEKASTGAPYRGYRIIYGLNITPSMYMTEVYLNSAGGQIVLKTTGTSRITDSNWHHIVITYNGNGSYTGLNAYNDGSLSKCIKSGGISGDMSTSQKFTLCNSTQLSNQAYLRGAIDEVGAWNRALSAEEIEILYNDGDGLPLDDFNKPVLRTYNASGITYNSAIFGGEILFSGDSAITTKGFCWSTGNTPTTGDTYVVITGNTDYFTGSTNSLSSNTTYYVKSFGINGTGISYGNLISFITELQPPTINGYLIDDDVTLQIVDENVDKEYYEIWRDIGGTGYTLVDTIYYTGTTWTDNDISTGITYSYKVRCKYGAIYSDYSNIINARIQILYAPTGLTISNVGYTGLTLTWVNNNVSGQTGNHVQRISGATWVTIEDVTSGTTTYNVSGLSPNTTYYFRIVAYNDVQEANSATAQDITLNPAPYGLTATTITLFYQDLSWSLPTPPFGDYIVVQYRIDGSGSAWTNAGTVGYNDTTFRLSGLTMGQDYEVRVVEHDNTFGNYYSASFVLEIPAPNFPLAFCEANAYAISGSTCGNADGQIQITNQEYLLYYDFGLTDVFGNVYSLTYDLYTGLTSGYYFLSATAKNEYKWFYGYDACFESWLQINDSDTPMYLASMRVKPAQCLSFDVSYGRIWFNVSGLATGNTYTFYAFTSDLSNVDSVTGCTGTTQFLIENAAPTCYYILIVDEVTGCKLLIANKCVPSIENFSQGGVKKLFIMPWNTNVDYDYWSTAEDDYFLEFEDTSFFLSTKIKQYYSATGGTGYTWYSLPVFPQVCKLEQKLSKVRQGYIFTDTLTLAVNYATAAKWLKMKDVLSSENKWIFVVQDADGYWWTGGYRHGASISTYTFTSGARGEDNGYQLVISAISENKLLTALDENYVNNYILK